LISRRTNRKGKLLEFAIMIRVTVFAIFIQMTLANPSHDDTAKRRSEEILRAVAAAATADYEGLRQMQAQKVETKDKISNTIATQTCVHDLLKVLDAEKEELDGSAANASTEAGNAQTNYTDAEENLKRVLHNALADIYNAIHQRYQQIERHANAMMQALQTEITQRETSVFTASGLSGVATAQEIFNLINTNAKKNVDGVNVRFTDKEILDALKDLMMNTAEERASKSIEGDATQGKLAHDQAREQLILLSGYLTGGRIGAKNTHEHDDYFNGKTHAWKGQWGTRNDSRAAVHEEFIELESAEVVKIEKQWAGLVAAEEGQTAAEVEKDAYTAAKKQS